MWSNTKQKSKTNKVLAKVYDLNKYRPYMKRQKGRQVTRIVRDNYGAPDRWFSLCKEVKRRDRYCCVKCGEPEAPKEGVYHDVHHIKELSHGGQTVKANLITLCKQCHAKRHKHMKKQVPPVLQQLQRLQREAQRKRE